MYLETMFIYHPDLIVETVKSKTQFKPDLWHKAFGEPMKKNILEAKIVHTTLGLMLPLKTFAVSPNRQTVEFAGLYGYNDRSKLLVQTFIDLECQLLQTRITRMDIAIDYEGKIPRSIIKALSKHREPFQYKNTTYWKTPKEKKTNQKMDIKIYNKAHKEKLDYPLMRVEFVFRSSYFNMILLKDIDKAISKMEKSIKKAIGINVKIKAISRA